jgi:chloramphenicol O-acetyltransferase
MTLYDLLSSGHRVWQVYDCFYSTGEEDQETFEFMISNGVKLNFEAFVQMYCV